MEIRVNLGERSYPVLVVHDEAVHFPARLREVCGARPCALVTNVTLERLYERQLGSWQAELGFVRVVIEDGEQHKTIATWQSVLDTLLAARLDRSALLIAFGGGVVGDITGFAAAAFLRGVDYVQVPTTLLAMVDASVGGKTGVDHPMGKNLVGAFHQPSLVWVDTAALATLPRRQLVAGYAEVFKNAFIGGADMFAFINQGHRAVLAGEADAMVQAIQRSIRVKVAAVEADEHERSGRRALLNFGHTFAHALERCMGYGSILHGEAVLWGIACACDLGRRVGSVPEQARTAYDELLLKLPLPPLPGRPDPQKLYEAMLSDKKARGGTLRFVLPTEPGTSVVRDDIGQEAVMATLGAVFGGN
jgi:3-dehydroquinate synthase